MMGLLLFQIPSLNSDHFKAQVTESVFSNQDISTPPSPVAATNGYRLPDWVIGKPFSVVEQAVHSHKVAKIIDNFLFTDNSL